MPTPTDPRATDSTSIRVLLNASHSVTGGGLIYLESIVPTLANVDGIEWVLVTPADACTNLEIPPAWIHRTAPRLGFFGLHLWEQLILPLWARRHGVAVTLC